METKIGEYHAFGVDLVWVLDARTLTLRAYPRNRINASPLRRGAPAPAFLHQRPCYHPEELLPCMSNSSAFRASAPAATK